MPFSPEQIDRRDYREALSHVLAQFLHGEEISFTAIPLILDQIDHDDLAEGLEVQLADEKRHHGMFDDQRRRLGLPRVTPSESITRFGDVVLDAIKRKDAVACVMAGCFMLEGAAFSTLLTHNDAVDTDLAETFREIVKDEAQHINLNISVVRRNIEDSPELISRVVDLHREYVPLLFGVFTTFAPLNDALGVDNEWFMMKCLFHHSQRIRRLKLPGDAGREMLRDILKLAPQAAQVPPDSLIIR